MSITYQSLNILEDFFIDNTFNYILSSTFIANPQYFPEIITYCKSNIPLWYPVLDDTRNRLAFNSSAMFEIIFHKTIIIVIPLYIPNYSIYENNLIKIKVWCENYIAIDNNNNTKLLTLLEYKLLIYTPVNNHINFKVDIVKTNKTILGTEIYMSMYETLPQKLNYILMPNSMFENNPFYIAYNGTNDLSKPMITN